MSHKPYTVFISHARDDKELAQRIADKIGRLGSVQVWLDTSRLDAGANWKDVIHGAMAGSDEVVVIVTEESASSPYLNLEVGAAVALGKRITPVVDRVARRQLPPILRAVQAVEARNINRYIHQLSRRVKAEELAVLRS